MTLSRAHDELVGRALGGFVLRERIGEGGFGAVYRANQPGLDREAVIKVLHARLHASKPAVDRFLREAKLASKLDHPYAAHIYAFGAEPDGELWIAMELVRGTPLDQILKVQGPIPLERLVPLLDRIAEVVHTAHEQGIVHRDIKPANVMVLSRAGRLLPKLLDFGIAKGLVSSSTPPPPTRDSERKARADTELPEAIAIDDTHLGSHDSAAVGHDDTISTLDDAADPESLQLTQRGAIMGSPHYMAPEQWIDAGHVDQRTDLYALGIVAYECLTGRPPFNGSTLVQITLAHANESPPPLGGRYPAALDAVFAKVLAKKADDRYPDALAFAAAFRQASGVAEEPVALPALDPGRRDAAMTSAPQPIAEAIAALGAARNAHQARDAIVQVARTIVRYLALVALACRARVTAIDEPTTLAELLRTLHRRTLTDAEWLELGTQLTRGWLRRRDAYPVPELVDTFHDRSVLRELEALLALREREAATEEALLEALAKAVVGLGHVLDALGFMRTYPLVVIGARGIAERWMGVRLAQRATVAVRGKPLPSGTAALVDGDGAPVLSLAPLFQVGAPTPGAPADMFLFDGRDARGAKLVALPGGFEHHDDEVWGWVRAQLADSLDEPGAATNEEKPPYRGLSAFSSDDGASFFGREKLVDAVVNRLKLQPLLAVVGPSGAGKSSFVHAGVVPALGWRSISLRPGASPLSALVARLDHAGLAIAKSELARDKDAFGQLLRADAQQRGPIVVIVDQLEELFTLCQDADERRAFAEALASAVHAPDDPVRVVLTLRDDFLVRTEQVPGLRNRLGPGLQLLTVPADEDLQRIVTEPARRAGYELEGDLADEMVRAVADQPGALALVSFTAQKLWELRDRQFKQLTRKAYQTLGGVGGALARHADVTLDEMPPEERSLAREAFRHLVTSQHTRAVLARKDLRQLLGGSDQADRVMEKLVAARLLVASENESGTETIEIVHEALLTAWPRLVEWRRDDAEGARLREQLRAAAAQWRERGRAKGLLWRGDALADYTRWRARHPGPLTDDESAFAEASLADVARARRTRRTLVAAAFIALGAGTVVFAVQSRQKKAQAEQLHDYLVHQYEDQGRRLVLAGDPLQALAYLSKAAEMGATGAAHDFVTAEAVRATDGELLQLRHDDAVRSPHFSSDGKRVITAGFDKQVRIWDAATGQQLLQLAHSAPVRRASFSPDDHTVLTGAIDGTVILWSASTGARIYELHHSGDVYCALYSPDGSSIVSGGSDGSLELGDAKTGETRVRLSGDKSGFAACDFSPDGALLAAGDRGGVTRVWDAKTGELRHTLADTSSVNELAFSPDGQKLVVATTRGTATVWSLANEDKLAVLPHQDAVSSAVFGRNGSVVLTASADRTAAVWDVATARRLLSLTGHAAAVYSARFTPDEQYIVTASGDASVQLWDASDGRAVAHWRGHRDAILDPPAFDPTGSRMITASEDGSAVIWRLAPQEQVRWFTRGRPTALDAQFSPDGAILAGALKDGTHLWNAVTGVPLRVLPGSSRIATFAPDGKLLATGSDDGSVLLWDVATGEARANLGKSAAPIGALAWSPRGDELVAGSDDGSLKCWRVPGGTPCFDQRLDSRAYGISFFPTGDRFLTVSEDATIRTWTSDGKTIASRRDPDLPASVDISPDGKHVLSVLARQRAKIWNAETGATETWLDGHVGPMVDGTWSADGAFAITSSFDGTARIWDAHLGTQLASISHNAAIYSARFSRDGRRVAVTGEHGIAVHQLPQLAAGELAHALACLPFEWNGDRPEPTSSPRSGCR